MNRILWLAAALATSSCATGVEVSPEPVPRHDAPRGAHVAIQEIDVWVDSVPQRSHTPLGDWSDITERSRLTEPEIEAQLAPQRRHFEEQYAARQAHADSVRRQWAALTREQQRRARRTRSPLWQQLRQLDEMLRQLRQQQGYALSDRADQLRQPSRERAISYAATHARELGADGVLVQTRTERVPYMPHVRGQPRWRTVVSFWMQPIRYTEPVARSGDVPSPLYVPAAQMRNAAGGPFESNIYPVSVSRLREQIQEIPEFPDYLYSGCHDRAHAAHLMLPTDLRLNSMKLWVFAPHRYTAGISGTIGLEPNPSRSSTDDVEWGYHVALAFRDSSDRLHVYDPALARRQVISPDEWFGMMKLPTATIWTLVPGWYYLFYTTAADPHLYLRDAGVFNGAFDSYLDESRRKGLIPHALARDAVGALAVRGEACAELTGMARKPGDLQDRLRAGDLPEGCAPEMALYVAEVQRWSQLLAPESDGSPE